MKHLYYIIIGAAVLVLASCGQKHQATALVEDFISQYALRPDEIEHRSFEHFDSTRVIGDSLLRAMQQRRHPLYRYPISYPDAAPGRKLWHIRMNYVCHGDTLWQTFYLDEQLDHVVAFK